MTIAERLFRKARAAAQVAAAIPPNPLDLGRIPQFGKSLPIKMGAGGWPIEEPTEQDLKIYLSCVKRAQQEAFHCFGNGENRYSAVICVQQWLELIVDAHLLVADDRPGR